MHCQAMLVIYIPEQIRLNNHDSEEYHHKHCKVVYTHPHPDMAIHNPHTHITGCAHLICQSIVDPLQRHHWYTQL